MGNMVKAITKDGSIKICALDSTEIVRRMEEIHKPSAVVSAALGRLLTAASLMGSWQKNPDDTMTLRVDGRGPAGVLVAVTDGCGNVRGYATQPIVEIPLRMDGKLNVGAAVGKDGVFTVIRDFGLKEPYIGQIALTSGEIGDDVTAYYATSEQTPTVCALGVSVNADLSIRVAGGYLLQLMPGAGEEAIAAVERNIEKMPPVTQLLLEGKTPADIVNMALHELSPEILETKTTEYRCYCNREKTRDILASLGKQELLLMRAEQESAQVECHFCEMKYQFNLDDIIGDLENEAK